MVRVAAAREKAAAEAQALEQRVFMYAQAALLEPVGTGPNHALLIKTHTRLPILSSKPLGYDRYGSSYWLLNVQEVSSLFPQQINGAAALGPSRKDQPVPVEPCVLMRDVRGWWGYHDGIDFTSLIARFGGERCERVLAFRLIERLAYARCYQRNSCLILRVMQKEWAVRVYLCIHKCTLTLCIYI
ncbi:hypothetical protein B484DRAFT_286493 [Ochromonadaceae sp. CCMP2298]|nr:hypothetical protein B484DRAFT_286493 [Ochromonadaceae sp. CCMP2298]